MPRREPLARAAASSGASSTPPRRQHGLHTPGGRVTTTGVGGFTTGGGYGWTSSKHGLTCDNLLSAEVVLADGRVVTASEQENADLFWGIRGGGGNFGIVTEFEYRLHQLGPIVLAGLALWPIERAADVVRAWRDYVDRRSRRALDGVRDPDRSARAVRARIHARAGGIGMAAMYVGDPGAGARVMQPLKDLRPAVDLIQPMPYTAFQAMIDPMAPKGFRSYWRGEYLQRLSDEAIDTFVQHGPELAAAGTPLRQVVIFRIGQGVTAVPDEATAFSHRDAQLPVPSDHDVAGTPADDDRLIAATRTFCEAMRPFSTGAEYLNFTPEDRVRDAYGAAKVPAAGCPQGPIRPWQPLPVEREHQAKPRSRGAGARLTGEHDPTPAMRLAPVDIDRRISDAQGGYTAHTLDRVLAPGGPDSRARPTDPRCASLGRIGPSAAGAYGDERCPRRSVTVVLSRTVPDPDREGAGRGRGRRRPRRAGRLAPRRPRPDQPRAGLGSR